MIKHHLITRKVRKSQEKHLAIMIKTLIKHLVITKKARYYEKKHCIITIKHLLFWEEHPVLIRKHVKCSLNNVRVGGVNF